MGENWRLRSPVFFGGGGLKLFFLIFFSEGRSHITFFLLNGIFPNVKEIFSLQRGNPLATLV